MRKSCVWAARLAGGLLVGGLAGCGGPAPGALYPVTGTVRAGGKPLADAEVRFIPAGDTRAEIVYGRTDGSGRYSLKTGGAAAGAPAGSYRVLVSRRVNPDGTVYAPTPGGPPPIESAAVETVAPAQSDPAASRLTATVPVGGGSVDLEVQVVKKK